MPESINQWATEYFGSIFFSLALWTVGAAAVGFFAGLVLFLFLRLVRIYKFKFQLGGLVAFLLFLYTVAVTTAGLATIGLFESASRQSETLVSDPDNQEMIGQFSGAVTSRGVAIAYAYGQHVQSTGNTDPDYPTLLKQIQDFDNGNWGIDHEKSDASFGSISDDAIRKNYESLYELVFKNTGNNVGDLRASIKPLLDWFIKPEELTAERIIRPLRNTLTAIQNDRSTTEKMKPVFAADLKTHAGEKTADFIRNKLSFWIRAQQVFAATVSIIALGVPIVFVMVFKLATKSSAKKGPPSATAQS